MIPLVDVTAERAKGRAEAAALLRLKPEMLKEWWQEHSSVSRYTSSTVAGGTTPTVQNGGYVRLAVDGTAGARSTLTAPFFPAADLTTGTLYIRHRFRTSGTFTATSRAMVGMLNGFNFGAVSATLGGSGSYYSASKWTGAWANICTTTTARDTSWHTATFYLVGGVASLQIDGGAVATGSMASALTTTEFTIDLLDVTGGSGALTFDSHYIQLIYGRST